MACIELCPDCPLRDFLPETDQPLNLVKVGEQARDRAETHISGDGKLASFSYERGAGPRQEEIAILPEGSQTGPAFWLKPGTFMSGVVQQAFENCESADKRRHGFLLRRKTITCHALNELNPSP